MLLILKLAWRNVFRNTRRTVLSALAIGIGLAAIILTDGFILGMKNSMIKMATDSLVGQAQIHSKGFRKTMTVENTIHNSSEVLKKLSKEKIISGYSPRTLAYGMLSSPENVSSIMVYGIQPKKEMNVSKINNFIIKGDYFNDKTDNKILVGKKLASDLEVEIGDKVVLTVAQANSGDLSQEMFRISGIFEFQLRELDRSVAFIKLAKAQKMLALGNGIHEIALHFIDISYAQNKKLGFWKNLSSSGNIAESWIEIMPDLQSLLELSQFSVYITAIILFSIVSLGIMNTLFMSLYERMFEFGVLRAIGTRAGKMALIIIGEAGAIAFLSIIIGIILGAILSYWLSIVGINYTGLEYGGLTFRERLYPVLTISQFIIYPLWLFGFTILIGLYPAFFAARIMPAKAMRRSF